MILNRAQVLILNNALEHKDLKPKPITGVGWVKIMKLKRLLRTSIDELVKDEAETMKAFGFLTIQGQAVPDGTKSTDDGLGLNKKLIEIQNAFSIDIPDDLLRFIPEGEFKDFVSALDVNNSSILFEYLMEDIK